MSPKPAARSAAMAVPAFAIWCRPASRGREQVEQPALVLIDEPPALLMGAEILAADEDRPGADRRRPLAQHRVGVGMLLRRDHGRAARA